MTIRKVEDLVDGLLDENQPIDMGVLRGQLARTTIDDIGRLEFLLRRLGQWPVVANEIENKAKALRRKLDRDFDEAMKMERQKAQPEASAGDGYEM
ncbi:hypothetical protein [Dyella psychrodurans]|uniref:Uncharacterized protein n=1 Tax=Dyella psychrodurans TaxID=1927960 RepID=A0A370X2X5_9GAMM|nr:hypothetical protein [Dyella psychrodurans]RDS82601.1 hypothetical protein DWU99_14470 [Dyella psychrodurans]